MTDRRLSRVDVMLRCKTARLEANLTHTAFSVQHNWIILSMATDYLAVI